MKTRYLTLLIASLMLIFTSCSKDDDSKSGNSDIPFDLPSQVPTGTIVPIAERTKALTGMDEMKSAETAKFWKLTLNGYVHTGCYEDEGEYEPEVELYYGFDLDGNVYLKYGKTGTPYVAGTWEFSSDSKVGISISLYPQAILYFTVLTANQMTLVNKTSYTLEVGGTCYSVGYDVYTAEEVSQQ